MNKDLIIRGSCFKCGKYIEKYRSRPKSKRMFCSRNCHFLTMKGEKKYPEEESKKRRSEGNRARNIKYRLTVLEHYGGKCICCSESIYEFLAMDHIDGKGDEHRNKIKKRGGNMYPWIIKNNFPNTLQILCHNCNMAKGFYGYCPHKKGSFLCVDFAPHNNVETPTK